MALGKNMKLNKDKLIGKAGEEKPETPNKSANAEKKPAATSATLKEPEVSAGITAPAKKTDIKPVPTIVDVERKSTVESRNKAEREMNAVMDPQSELYMSEQLNKVLYALDAF